MASLRALHTGVAAAVNKTKNKNERHQLAPIYLVHARTSAICRLQCPAITRATCATPHQHQQSDYVPPHTTAAMVDTPPQIPPPECSTPGQVVRTKRQKLDPSQGAPEDMVRLLPLSKQPDLLAKGWRPVQLSKHDKAPGMTLSDDQRAVSSSKGYRMVRGACGCVCRSAMQPTQVRCTHGVHSGTYYFEVKVTSLGSSGHCRVGWAKKQAELQAPVHAAWAGLHGLAYTTADAHNQCSVFIHLNNNDTSQKPHLHTSPKPHIHTSQKPHLNTSQKPHCTPAGWL